jgi:hypothetical protein
MENKHLRTTKQIVILVTLACICGCTSLRPLEPGGAVYPPGNKHTRYDMVPQHSCAIGIPVTGLRGNPSQLRIRIRDQYNQALEFDSEVTPTTKEGYLLYKLDKSALLNRYTEAEIENPPAQVTVEITDKPDPDEGFIMRWFRWWGRSDSTDYFIVR